MNSRQFTVDEEIFANHGERIANFLIDYLVRSLLVFAILFVASVVAIANGYNLKEIETYIATLSVFAQFTIGLVVMLVYYNCFEIFFAATIGKLITKTIVVDAFGNKPDANTILMRSIYRAIPLEFLTFFGIPCYGWHDRFSQTFVVRKEALKQKRKAFDSFNEIGNQDSET